MLSLTTTKQYRKDRNCCKKRGYDMSLLDEVIEELLMQNPLAAKYRDHSLTGNFTGFRECHILPDWLLIYKVDKGKLILTASRTGTHSDLLEK